MSSYQDGAAFVEFLARQRFRTPRDEEDLAETRLWLMFEVGAQAERLGYTPTSLTHSANPNLAWVEGAYDAVMMLEVTGDE